MIDYRLASPAKDGSKVCVSLWLELIIETEGSVVGLPSFDFQETRHRIAELARVTGRLVSRQSRLNYSLDARNLVNGTWPIGKNCFDLRKVTGSIKDMTDSD